MFNELAKQIHEGNAARGFWEGERKLTEVVMLTVCELSEAIEADRSGKWATEQDIIKYLNRTETFKETIKDTVQDEIADAIIRLLDFSHKFNIDIDEIIDFQINHFSNLDFDEKDNFVDKIFIITSCFTNMFEPVIYGNTMTVQPKQSSLQIRICECIILIEKLSKIYNIDLDFHIKAKLNYNASRPYKHGKSY